MKIIGICFMVTLCLLVLYAAMPTGSDKGRDDSNMEYNTMTAKQIVSLELSYKGSGMRPYQGYKYHLREQEGAVLFDANFYAGSNFIEITLENAVISREDIDAIVEILGGISALDKLRNVEKDPPIIKNDLRTDGPHYNEIIEVQWENETGIVKAPPNDDRKLVLFNYLQMLAIRLALPPAEGNIISFTFHGKDSQGNFHYTLKESSGEITFYATYPFQNGRKSLERTPVTREDIQALQAICDNVFAGVQQTYCPSLPPGYTPDEKKAKEKYSYIEVNWENGAILNANTTFGSGDALKTFFLELALRLADQKGS